MLITEKALQQARQIKAARALADLTQKEAAKKLGITEALMGNLEQGRVEMSDAQFEHMLRSICPTFDINSARPAAVA